MYNSMDKDERIKELEQQIEELKNHLKKYTAPTRYKTYYENHKQELLARNKAYHVSPEKKKEYARRAYLNKKEKLKKEKEENEKKMEENI